MTRGGLRLKAYTVKKSQLWKIEYRDFEIGYSEQIECFIVDLTHHTMQIHQKSTNIG